MILPSKHVSTEESMLGLGATLLQHIKKESSLSDLWEKVKIIPSIATFERFILALNLIYLLGLIDIKNNNIVLVSKK